MTYPENKKWRQAHPEEWKAQKGQYYASGSAGEQRRWTPEEDEVVLARAKPDRELSFDLNRSIQAIQIRRTRLKKASPAASGEGNDR